jgi:hypothetical protein
MFSLMLTVAYSIFQGNVGTAYRQRTQIQVFLFILVAVGWTVYKEGRENKRLIQAEAQRRVEEQIRANAEGRWKSDPEPEADPESGSDSEPPPNWRDEYSLNR